MGTGSAVSRPLEENYQVINDALPFPSQTQSDYGEDISGLILAFDEEARQNSGPLRIASDNPSTTTTSLTIDRKRSLGESLDTSSSTTDARPTKKHPLDNNPNHPYIIASSRLVQEFPGLPCGVRFELARMRTASTSKFSYDDITPEHLNKLKGSNAESAAKTVRVLFPDAASDVHQDPAFAQENAAKLPWEELDTEQEALSRNPYAGLGNSKEFPDWYGGKVNFRGKLQGDKGSYSIVLERCALGPSCRFTRRFGSKNFLRIKIPDKIRHAKDNGLIDFFLKPFVLWGEVFRAVYAKDGTVFLFKTNEMMVGHEIVPNQGSGISLLELVNWHNPLHCNQQQMMSKWATRMALGFSNSLPGPMLDAENILDEIDIVSAQGSDMTDGCGLSSKSTTVAVTHKVGSSTHVSAFQCRVDAAKGMVMEKRETEPNEPMKIWLRPSQKKIAYPPNHHDPLDPTRRIIEIIRTSKMRTPARLSPEVVINLAENGVPHAPFINLLKQNLAEMITGLTTFDGVDAMYNLWVAVERAEAVLASRRAREAPGEARARGLGDRSETDANDDEDDDDDEDGMKFDAAINERSSAWWTDQTSGQPSSLAETVMVLLDAGFKPLESPILLEKLKKLLTTLIKNITKKYHCELAQSATAFVVPDPYGVLGPDEVQIKNSSRNLKGHDGLLTDTILGDVLMTRNPCKLPTDVRKVRAVEHPLLRDYTDVIVCSTQGLRRLLDYLAGGDYDGDTALVIWALEFVLPFMNADEQFSTKPTELDGCFVRTGNEKGDEFLKRTSSMSTLEQTQETQKYLLGALLDTSVVGKYSKMHDYAVYTRGYKNPSTVRLAWIYATALDAAKSGLRINSETLKEDVRKYNTTRGPKWNVKFEDRARVTNTTFARRDKCHGPFIMDVLEYEATKARDKALVHADQVLKPPACTPDSHLTQPWEHAVKMASRGTPELCDAKKRDLDRITSHVQNTLREHKSKIQKQFTGQPIELRQDILRNLSKRFAAFPAMDEMETMTDPALILRLCASYAYKYDLESAKRPGWTRFPWDMALRELCQIKASALGPSKTVTNGFYERFMLKMPRPGH